MNLSNDDHFCLNSSFIIANQVSSYKLSFGDGDDPGIAALGWRDSVPIAFFAEFGTRSQHFPTLATGCCDGTAISSGILGIEICTAISNGH
jgi:hypothetical protein